MFHEHRVDVTSHLKSGYNNLGIIFESALKKGREEISKRGNLICWNGESSRLYVRKAQYHWGWDWGNTKIYSDLIVGPVMMSAGPWKPIRLESYQSRIEEVHFPVSVSDDLSSATIDYTIIVESPPRNATLQIALYPPENDEQETRMPVYIGTVEAGMTATGRITLKNPKLWYPVGYGSQPLYIVAVELHKDKNIIHSTNQTLGIRLAKVVQTSLKSEKGTSFHFEINNIPIFCGGSNWIPADNILTRLTSSKYHDWLSLVVKGNQNMIRVWGGGIYESDVFYSTADKLGILIWQDFLFACGQYPCHLEFRKNVEREAITQVKRLRKHPSVVLFAGNNEDYQIAEATKLDWDPKDMNPENWLKTNFPARYIYEKLLPDVVSKYSGGVFYHPGSPWGEGKPTSDKTVGDIHQWNGTSHQMRVNLCFA
jgi:beta-mannosidase